MRSRTSLAGIPTSSLRGSRSGVYVTWGAIDSTAILGGTGSFAADLISNAFDLLGPKHGARHRLLVLAGSLSCFFRGCYS
jgi:hypothetical protein